MKKKILVLALSTLFLSSCEKFLDTTPLDTLSPKGYFNTEKEAQIALTGVYDILAKSPTYGRRLFFELDVADDSFVALSNWTQNVALFNYNPSDTDITDLWILLYNGINRANVLLENLPKVQMDGTKKQTIEGQALFLRAYYYFLLTNYWGDVPLRLSSTKSVSDNQLERSPYKVVYAQIVSDMEKAAELVEPAGTYPYGSRVTKSVVWGILARVNLKMGGAPLRDQSRFAEAKKWAEKVINTKYHVLNPDYRDVFIRMCNGTYDPKETIWEVEFNRYNESQQEEGSVGVINGISATAEIGFSYGSKHTTELYFKQFENVQQTINGYLLNYSPDIRRDWTISPYYYATGTFQRTNYSSAQIYNRMDGKWRREYETEETKFNGTSTINFPLLRYSDVLLMYAEADNEISGPQPDA
ncbi:MAG: RagB/SusD family nutrient uptake outer membrane protein, partial [Pedobacter sp.]